VSLRVGIVAGRSTRSLDRIGTMTMRLAIIFAAATVLHVSEVSACSCIPSFSVVENAATRANWIKGARVIVHARITQVLPDQSGVIEIIESFKGGRPTKLVPLQFPAMCGTQFEVGEERVFFAFGPTVNSCGKLEPSPELLRVLRESK